MIRSLKERQGGIFFRTGGCAADLAQGILKIFEDRERLEQFHEKSYEIGKGFLQEVIAEKWQKLLRR